MSEPRVPTLEQLAVFAKVADCGSFSAAARALNRTQSVISYTIARLEEQLGVTLFDRDPHRPVLTVAGQALLGDSRRVGLAIDDLRARAKGLGQGLEAEISIAVDAMLPDAFVVDLCRHFAAAFPTVSIALRVETPDRILQLVLDRRCAIGLTGPIMELPDGIERRHYGVVPMLTVVAAGHPLAQFGDGLSTATLRDHTQLMHVADKSRQGIGGFTAHAVRIWPISNLALLQALLRAGLGWAVVPQASVADDLASGALVRLALAGAAEWPYPVDLVRRVDTPMTAATEWIAGYMAQAFARRQGSRQIGTIDQSNLRSGQ